MPSQSLRRRSSTLSDPLSCSGGVTNLLNQIMFFMLCDRLFCPREKLTGLYSLLFYNVISYIVQYAKEALKSSRRYSPVVLITNESNLGHLAMSATKLVLDLTKVISFVITGVFILLVFGMPEQTHFNPSWCYIAVTVVYYCLTERTSKEQIMADVLTHFRFDMFESLEILWTPVLIRLITSFSSGILITLVWLFTSPSSWILILAASYVNVYLCLKEMDQYWKILMAERSGLDKYRFATGAELAEKCDDVCAVCLQEMSHRARVTPCRHFFHSDCLRRCLRQTNPITDAVLCPMCKQQI